jgi:hypothetical protein
MGFISKIILHYMQGSLMQQRDKFQDFADVSKIFYHIFSQSQ